MIETVLRMDEPTDPDLPRPEDWQDLEILSVILVLLICGITMSLIQKI